MPIDKMQRVHFKMSRVGGDTNPGGLPWAVPARPVGRSPPNHFQCSDNYN